jgi:hypothetical protein
MSRTPEMELAFHHAKQAVCGATSLAHPDPTAPLSFAVDASDSHGGGGPSAAHLQLASTLVFLQCQAVPSREDVLDFQEIVALSHISRSVPFPFSTGSHGVPCFDGSQTPDLCAAPRLRAMVGQAAKAPLLPGGIYSRHSSCGRERKCGGRCFIETCHSVQRSLLFKRRQASSRRKRTTIYTTSSDRVLSTFRSARPPRC